MNLDEILEQAPKNNLIGDSIIVTYAKLRQYKKILCSVSGGSDSDILVDLCQKFGDAKKLHMFFLILDWSLKQQKNI